jgi:hypothetical protein
VETAKLLLGEGRELNGFVSQLLDDIANLKAMLHAISIGGRAPPRPCPGSRLQNLGTWRGQWVT